MNYYSHHIGDFDRATRHLTRIERSVYLDLMFVYYDTEQPLTADIATLCRKIVARSEEEKSAVLAILDEFFVSTPTGWFHARCEDELDAYRKSNSQRAIAGRASAAARAARKQQALNGNSTVVGTSVEQPYNGTSTNHKPITNNQEPETKNQEPQKAKSKASATGTRLPADWRPSEADIEYCKTERPDLRPSLVATNFYDYWIAKAGSAGRKADWSATWRSWVRKESAATSGRGNMPPRAQVHDLDAQRQQNTEDAMRLLGITTDDDEARTINAK
ncbi:YdaU family protein [Paludibacterium sp.]|uniref:YdaU family protein n=1 Tax=Paludibacterium sp. TaxID=1917523 RepID=UPI0025F89C8B|nr:YdaU family protein [Paludibacterium sp.]MBV8649704.1 YdaU family protein [Paludibacterium sp.]